MLSFAGRSLRFYVTIGFIIREVLSFWTGHPFDFEIWLRNAYYVSLGRNPYDHFPPIPGLSFAYLNVQLASVGYLPLWSLILAFLYRVYSTLGVSSPFFLYFLLKQPEVVGDILLGYALFKMVLRFGGTLEASKSVLRFWMFSPFPIIISAIWGQFDGLVALLWASYLLILLPIRRSLILGFGILLKFFPAVLLPHYLFRAKRPSLPTLAIAGFVPVAFTALAFFVLDWNFQPITQTLLSALYGDPAGMTYIRVFKEPTVLPIINRIPYFFLIYGVIWIPAVLIGSVLALKLFPELSAANSIQASLLILIIFFLTRLSVYEQYMIYLLAFLLIDVSIWHPQRRGLFHFTWLLALSFLAVNNLLLIRFLGPAMPAAVDYDYFLDSTSMIAGLRYALMDVLAVLFSVHLVQLALVIANPKRNPSPWFYLLLRPIVSVISPRLSTSNTQTN